MPKEQDKKVLEYIGKQDKNKKEILKKLRKLLFKVCPEIKEEFKMGVPWYGKFYLVALKDKVNMGFSVLGLRKQEMDNFEGKGKNMRHLKFFTLKEINSQLTRSGKND